MRWLFSLADFILDAVLWSAPRKGNLFPAEDVEGPDEAALAPVRERLASDLLNAPGYGACKCMDCVCGFNKPDPNARPGRSVE